MTGVCTCPINYANTTACEGCAPGYYGKKCGLYRLNVTDGLSQLTAAAYGYCKYSTFDGLFFNFPIAGEFTFIETSDMSIYIRQVCHKKF